MNANKNDPEVPMSRRVALVKMAEWMKKKAREEGNTILAEASLPELIRVCEEILECDREWFEARREADRARLKNN